MAIGGPLGTLLSAGMSHIRSVAASAAVQASPAAQGPSHSSKPDAFLQQQQAVAWTEQGLPFCDASLWEVIAVTGLTAVLNSPDDWDAVPSHMYQGCAWWLAVTAEACMSKHTEQQQSLGTAADGLKDCTLPALEAHLTVIGEHSSCQVEPESLACVPVALKLCMCSAVLSSLRQYGSGSQHHLKSLQNTASALL